MSPRRPVAASVDEIEEIDADATGEDPATTQAFDRRVAEFMGDLVPQKAY